MTYRDVLSLDGWTDATVAERRAALAAALREALGDRGEIAEITIEPGPIGREFDLTVVATTDVGRMRTPLWSHARAMMYEDPSIHPANREQFSPAGEIEAASDRLRRRLAVPYALESRGLTVTLSPEPGVERTWTAEHSTFRRRTSVTREDRVENAADVDVRDLLAHFYTGPSLRLVSADGDPFLLPARAEVEGLPVTLCYGCGSWSEGSSANCSACGSDRVEAVIAARP